MRALVLGLLLLVSARLQAADGRSEEAAEQDRKAKVALLAASIEARTERVVEHLKKKGPEKAQRIKRLRRGKIDPSAIGTVNDQSTGAIRFANDEIKKKQVADAEADLEEMNQRLQRLESRSELVMPELPRKLQVGAVGVLEHRHGNSVQVIDATNMLVEIPLTEERVWISGVSTAGIADDKGVELPQVFEVTGTTSYQTALGAKRTVLMLERFDTAGAEALVLELAKQRIADAAQKKASARTPVDPEKAASSSLKIAKQLLDRGNKSAAETRLKKIVEEFPETPAAKEAAELLD